MLGEARAAQPGALTLDSAEPEFEFDERGEVSAIVARAQTESHRLIEHLMIAANEAVARRLERQGTPCLYRVHERPLAESVERLVDQLATLDVPTPPVPEGLSRTQAAELVGEISRRVEEHVRRDGRARAGRASGRRLADGWAAGAELARAAGAAPGVLHAGQPRPRGAGVGLLLPLHLADPPLPGSGVPPGAAREPGSLRARAARGRAWRSWGSGARNASARRW